MCLPVYKMGRSEFANLDLLTFDQVRGMMADGSLAVGTSNVYRLPWEFYIPQELADPSQAGLDHGRLYEGWSETRFLQVVVDSLWQLDQRLRAKATIPQEAVMAWRTPSRLQETTSC